MPVPPADLDARIEAFFDASASAYDRAYGDPGASGRTLRRRAAVALALIGDAGGDVLDVGMGGGYLCAELDRRGWRVSGVDAAPAMVERAVERLPHLRDRLVRGSIHALPYPAERFDAVVATGVLEYAVSDLDAAVSELVRILRPRGTAVVSYPNHNAPSTIWRGRVLYPLVRVAKRLLSVERPPPPPRVPPVSFSSLKTSLERAGLVIDVIEPVGVRPFPASLAERLETSRSRLAFALAAQLVLRARKST
jgi:ubiquinone/menaquinone biosynthesis C-methylase UbiE